MWLQMLKHRYLLKAVYSTVHEKKKMQFTIENNGFDMIWLVCTCPSLHSKLFSCLTDSPQLQPLYRSCNHCQMPISSGLYQREHGNLLVKASGNLLIPIFNWLAQTTKPDSIYKKLITLLAKIKNTPLLMRSHTPYAYTKLQYRRQ